jgi:acetate kinase
MTPAILSLNAGSSSLKFALHGVAAGGALDTIASGMIEGIGRAPHLMVHGPNGETLAERQWEAGETLSHEALLDSLLDWIEEHAGADTLIGIGHRVVHGGTDFAAPVLITEAVLGKLDRLSPLAPLHQPHNLAAIRAAISMRPRLPHVACFDTAFHRTLPAVATRFALPRALEHEGVRRYGFHGLSYDYVARRLKEIDPELASGRVIAAHLGNGASLCALVKGRSIDTTMGFTALDGLMMGTRCGAIDPGVLLYLEQEKGLSPDEVQHLLYEKSGLLGVSGLSGDMRDLLGREEIGAREAIELFVYRIMREAGALASVMGGLDGLVFTAGIGENAPEIRARVCRRLAWLGIALDEQANEDGAAIISTVGSPVRVHVIPTDEERMIAIHTLDLIGHNKGNAHDTDR